MRRLVPIALSAALLGATAGTAHAGTLCVTSGMPVAEGTACSGVRGPADATVRAAPSIVTVSGRAGRRQLAVTGATVTYTVPPGARAWVLGREYDAPSPANSPSPSPSPSATGTPSPDLCVTNYVGPAQGTVCEDRAQILPGSASVMNKTASLGVYYVDRGGDAQPLGNSSVEMRYGQVPPGARLYVDGQRVFSSGM